MTLLWSCLLSLSLVSQVRVPEDTSPWKDILQLSAEDQESNSTLYSIHSSLHPNSLKYFHLDPKSGVLVLTEALDYEDIAKHTLVIMVKQCGINGSAIWDEWLGEKNWTEIHLKYIYMAIQMDGQVTVD